MPVLTEKLPQLQERLYWNPTYSLQKDLYEVYELNQVNIGWPEGAKRMFDDYARSRSGAFVGLMFGDEGKGRIVDNKIGSLQEIPGVKMVYVIRYQGGNNAGHTVEAENVKIAVHQIPSGILRPDTVGVMDRGMIIHPEALKVELEDAEEKVGSLNGRLILSEEAILCTDLERAEEVFNRILSGGKSSGGTSMGISPAYARSLDRTGMKVKDFFQEVDEKGKTWVDKLEERYSYYEKYFKAFGVDLKDIEVPDLRETRKQKKLVTRKVGTISDFISRFTTVRNWFLERDKMVPPEKKLVQNTFLLHQKIFTDLSKGIILEGAQGIGIHPWLGNRPDVTSSDTTIYGGMSGTAVFRPQDLADRMGIFKLTYTSIVPDKDMPTRNKLPMDIPETPPKDKESVKVWKDYIEKNKKRLTPDQIRAMWIIMYAHEYGTTTGRLRGVHNLDLEVARYNARMGGIETLGATHLDVSRILEDGSAETILVCTHYEDENGNILKYQPGLEYNRGVKPHYVALPGWNGEKVRTAESFDDLPLEAKQFLAFVERRIGVPIVVATSGPERKQLIEFAGYDYAGPRPEDWFMNNAVPEDGVTLDPEAYRVPELEELMKKHRQEVELAQKRQK